MKGKHFSLAFVAVILLFACTMQPAFTQKAPDPCPCNQFAPLTPPSQHKTASPELGVVLVDLPTKQSRRFYCVAAEKLEPDDNQKDSAR